MDRWGEDVATPTAFQVITDPSRYQAGDLVFCHSNKLIGRLIRFGEHLRGRGQYNHVCVLAGCTPGGIWTVIQAEASGVTAGKPLQSVAKGGEVTVVRLPTAANVPAGLVWLRKQIGRRYGWVTIFSIILTLLSPRFVNLLMPRTWICSAVATEYAQISLQRWLSDWADLNQVMPDELFEAVGA